MDDSDKITIISNRSGELLRDRVVEEFSAKLGENARVGFQRKNSFAKNFPSGEVYVQLQENVRRKRVHIVAGFYRPELYHLRKKVLELDGKSGIGKTLVRDYLHSIEPDYLELLKILDAARRSGSEEISVYMSYFPDSRQDKKDEPRVPISAKLKFDQLESAGAPKLHRIGVIDIHAQQEQGFTNLPVDQINPRSHILLSLKQKGVSFDNLTLVSADPNNYKATKKFADRLGLGLAVILKSRPGHNQVDDKSYIEGNSVSGRTCAILDDLIDTGGTIFSGVDVLMKKGAKKVYACATHGIFSPIIEKDKVIFAEERFKKANRKYGLEVITTDTIARSSEYLSEHKNWLSIISVAPLIADLIYCNETGSSHGAKLEGYIDLAKTNDGSALERFLIYSERRKFSTNFVRLSDSQGANGRI